jgi:outer membrane murein-binding lipoprotein Lpp
MAGTLELVEDVRPRLVKKEVTCERDLAVGERVKLEVGEDTLNKPVPEGKAWHVVANIRIIETAVGLLLAVMLAGCTFTMSMNEAKPDDSVGLSAQKELTALQGQVQKFNGAILQMTKELQAAPDDVASIDAILTKYGIRRRAEAATTGTTPETSRK